MWKKMLPVWQTCFGMAWEAYCHGSFPVGAVIVDHEGQILVKERNRRFDTQASPGIVYSTNLAHAELNALITLGKDKYENSHINAYALYSTMEPCPMCFSAFYLSGVRTLHYASRDSYGGSTNLYGITEYFKRKTVTIHGPDARLEAVQIVLATDFIRRTFTGEIFEILLDIWRQDCPHGVALGECWAIDNTLQQAKVEHANIETIVSTITRELDMQG